MYFVKAVVRGVKSQDVHQLHRLSMSVFAWIEWSSAAASSSINDDDGIWGLLVSCFDTKVLKEHHEEKDPKKKGWETLRVVHSCLFNLVFSTEQRWLSLTRKASNPIVKEIKALEMLSRSISLSWRVLVKRLHTTSSPFITFLSFFSLCVMSVFMCFCLQKNISTFLLFHHTF